MQGRWNILRTGRIDGDGLGIPSMPLAAVTQSGSVRLAVGAGGEARLLVPLAAGEKVGVLEIGGSLQIGVTTLMHQQRAIRFLDVVCKSPDLESVFGEVVDDIVRRLADRKDGVEAVAGAIGDFRALLVPSAEKDVDRSRVVGLVAELVVLNRLLEISPSAWRSWRGPAGDRHDFRTRDISLEVKASLGVGARQVTINGIDQLEPPTGGRLYLAHLILEAVGGGLLTVAALGDRALQRADDPAGLRALLVAVGCTDVRDAAWNRFAFRAEAERLYCVGPNFPRIAPSSFAGGLVPAGVVDATYSIDLSLASGSECQSAEFVSLLQELCR
ncbi:PD-(D/E)XK motif protein [Tabrizicola sp.]|uniref:PD-(D/E)XK motif protein n=1 Tax=Tabrizicola sp. TaxID=2005166 RepID=UPI0035B32F9C